MAAKRVSTSTAATSSKRATTTKVAPPSKPAGPKSTASAHPPYIEMVLAAVQSLKQRGGCSRQAILKYILDNYAVGADAKTVTPRLKKALLSGLASGSLKNTKGSGAAGSFQLASAAITKKPAAENKSTKVTTPPKKARLPMAKSSPKKVAKKSSPIKVVKSPKPKTNKPVVPAADKSAPRKKVAATSKK